MAKQPIQIDLRRDLPKVREQLEAILPNMGECKYAAPCAIGAMIPPRRRAPLDRVRNDFGPLLALDALVGCGRISLPMEQLSDAVMLQEAFDSGERPRFMGTLARLETKYLTEQSA